MKQKLIKFKSRSLRSGRSILAAALFLLIFSIALPLFDVTSLSAKENLAQPLVIKQEIKGETTVSAKTTVSYTITAAKTNPAVTALDNYSFALTGNTSKTFSVTDFAFKQTGIYVYYLKPDKQTNIDNLHIDRSQYKLEVYVFNSAEGRDYYLILKNEQGEKLSDLTFEHEYKPQATSATAKPSQTLPTSTNTARTEASTKADGTMGRTGEGKLSGFITLLVLALTVVLYLEKRRLQRKLNG